MGKRWTKREMRRFFSGEVLTGFALLVEHGAGGIESVKGAEDVGMRLGMADCEPTAGNEGLVKLIHEAADRQLIKVDHDVPADDEVELAQVTAGERWRIIGEIVLPKVDALAAMWGEQPFAVLAVKAVSQNLHGEATEGPGVIGGGAGDAEEAAVDIGAQDIDIPVTELRGQKGAQEDGDGVGLCTDGATSAPDPQGAGVGVAFGEVRKNDVPEGVEHLKVTEEEGFTDGEFFGQSGEVGLAALDALKELGGGKGLLIRVAAVEGGGQIPVFVLIIGEAGGLDDPALHFREQFIP